MIMACEQHMYQMPHFLSQDTSTEWRVIKIFYRFPLRSKLIYVSPENQLPVCTSCMPPRHVLLGHLDPWRQDWLVIPKYWNVVTTLCCRQSQNLFKTCSISVCPSIRRMQNGGVHAWRTEFLIFNLRVPFVFSFNYFFISSVSLRNEYNLKFVNCSCG